MSDPIEHIVVLILENHSFDQMLGCFKEKYPKLEGVDPTKPQVNVADGKPYAQAPTTERQMKLDPKHEVAPVKEQLENCNGGFVQNFINTHEDRVIAHQQAPYIMGYYPKGFLPALHALADDFTICDHWYASLPGPTWPNRFFALSGTSSGKHDMPEDGTHGSDLAGFFEQDQDTIFDRLSAEGIHWKVYFHDIPQTWVLDHQRRLENVACYYPIHKFYEEARGLAEDFPQFCLIEPDYNGTDENDDHPPHDVMKAEKLIADVYNALRSNEELWKKTLLVVFYDEHGGFYDHVSPPDAVFPDKVSQDVGYPFNRYGVRVPAVLVSPWVDRQFVSTTFDHTSLLKYVCDKWKLPYLGERTKNGNSIGSALRLNGQPRQDTIKWIQLDEKHIQPPDPDVEEQTGATLSDHHIALSYLVNYMKLEADEEAPVALSSFARIWESIKAFFGGSGPKQSLAESASARYDEAQERFPTFLKAQKEKAKPVLAKIIRDESKPERVRRNTARILGEHVGRRLHKEPLEHTHKWLLKHNL